MLWIILALIIALLLFAFLDAPGRNEIANLTFSHPDFYNLRDGIFTGSFKGKASHTRDTKLELVVCNGEVSKLKILKGAVDKNGKPTTRKDGKRIVDVLYTAVGEKTLDVDVISGATITTKTHLKALEDALMKAEYKSVR
ncbi:MAG: FMN-binding protein [Spirochaetia bacterium]|nr:FMN-binding protein [Spirochaetia bacterium]